MSGLVGKKIFFTRGVGFHKERLVSFELALRDAGIEKFNLVHVSSIFPPKCKIVSRTEGLKHLSPGEIVFCVMARNETNEPHRLLSASVGCAIPKDRTTHGYLSEHHAFGDNEHISGDYAEDLAAQMLATTLGIEFDSEAHYDERKELWKVQHHQFRTMNVTQTAVCPRGKWVSIVASAVMIP